MASLTYPAASLWPLRRIEEDPLAFLETLASSMEEVVPFRLGKHSAFLLNHPAHVQSLLVDEAKTFVKGRGYDRARALLGNGLLTASGDLQAERRRLAQGAFRRHHLEAYAALIVAKADHLRATWATQSTIDVSDEMRVLTLAIAGECFFGADLGEFSERIGRAIALATPRMNGLISVVTGRREARRARRELDLIIDHVLERRRRSEGPAEDLLSLLLGAHAPGDAGGARQLRDDALTFLLAGHDTMTHALTWTWLLLSEHPDVDAALASELDTVLGTRLPTAADLPRLTYTRSVFAESLRLFPPAWVIVRRSAASLCLGRTQIPAGALVVASPFVLHRDRRYFAEPGRFIPRRWIDSLHSDGSSPSVNFNKSAYFPFGAGPRSCVGEAFAWMEGTLVLATLAQSWRLSGPAVEVRPLPRITLRPDRPVFMTSHPRTARVARDGGTTPRTPHQ